MVELPPSWILELRSRLETPPPRRLPAQGHEGEGQATAPGAPSGSDPGPSGRARAAPALAAQEGRRAAVLVPLYVDAGQLWVLLTRRSEEVPYHRGQVAFPGGALELGETPWEAALRETREEIGLEPTKVLPLGQLDEASTPSGFHIVPCVGAVAYPVETRIHQAEIAEVFAIPLLAFADPRLVEQMRVEIEGVLRDITVFHVGRHRIWGLTARVLHNLLDRLGISPT